MANKRMFNIKIVDSDSFLDMPLTAQCLYFHLNMRADDDGFVGNPKRVQRLIGASDDDMRLLIAKRFVLTFDDGVIVIKHWRMHNTLSTNRYKETTYIDQKKELLLKENNAYSFNSGVPLDDSKMIEKSSRLSQKQIDATLTRQRRTIDATLTDTGLELGLELDKGLDLDIDKDIDKVKVIELDKELDNFIKLINKYTNDCSLRENLIEFVKMMKSKQDKKFEIENLNFVLRKLDSLTKDVNEKISIVEQSINKKWNNFYPVKKERTNVPEWYTKTEQTKASDEKVLEVMKLQRKMFAGDDTTNLDRQIEALERKIANDKGN